MAMNENEAIGRLLQLWGNYKRVDPKMGEALDIAIKRLSVLYAHAADDLYEALEAQEAYDNHAHECEPCQSGWHCVEGADLSTKAQELRAKALAKARGES